MSGRCVTVILNNKFTKVHSHSFIHSNRPFLVMLTIFCLKEIQKQKQREKTVISIVNCFIILHLYIIICFTVKNFGGMFYSLSVYYTQRRNDYMMLLSKDFCYSFVYDSFFVWFLFFLHSKWSLLK